MLEEIDLVMPNGVAPTYADVGKLVYCTAVLKEALRLYPPAPLTARNTTAPLDLLGVDIPVGTLVWVPIWCVHSGIAETPHNQVVL